MFNFHIQHLSHVVAVCLLDDYFDTEDPSVNLHEFIVNSMQVCALKSLLLSDFELVSCEAYI